MNDKAFLKSYPPVISELYDELLAILKRIGPFKAEVKKTSIHLVTTKAFAGVHPMKSYLGVNLVLAGANAKPQAYKVDQVSKNRYRHFFQITSASQMVKEFKTLIKEAYFLMDNGHR
jgi:hypothetical protein